MPPRPRDPTKRRYRARIGYEGEYYLMKKFTELSKPGYYAVRTPGSGSGKVIKPDILAVENGDLYAVEVKSTNKSEAYVSPEQVARLRCFAELFIIRCPGCGTEIKPKPVIAVRFLRRGWVFREIEDGEESLVVKLGDER